MARCDYHLHTRHIGCAGTKLEVDEIAATEHALGVNSIGITDHLNTPEQVQKHLAIRDDILALKDVPVDVYLGVEIHTTAEGERACTEEVMDKVGFQFVIGGPHHAMIERWDVNELVKQHHRLHIMTCEDELINVLVHPWWFNHGEFEKKGFPFFNDLSCVPTSMIDELAHAAAETKTAIEINGAAIFASPMYTFKFKHQYVEYLARLAENDGVMFSIGSDAHHTCHLRTVPLAERAFDEAGIPKERLWHPPGEPLYRGKKEP